MKLTIMNPLYIVQEYNMYSQDLKEFIKDVKSMKDIICKRKCKENNKDTNISGDFIMNKIEELKRNDDTFAFAIYQSVLIYDKQLKKPTAILFAKKASQCNTYILLLICKYEGTIKGLGTVLLEKLVDKAKQNNITEIFVESTQNAKKFYKQYNFDSESDKEQFTKSEKQEECFGYLYKINIDKKIDESTLIGGSDNEYKFNYNIDMRELKLFDANMNIMGEMRISKLMDPIYGYMSLDIDDYNEMNPITNILIRILDCICENNMIFRTRVLINPTNINAIKMFENNGYIHRNKKIEKQLYYVDKLHTETHIIDRTVLSYNYEL